VRSFGTKWRHAAHRSIASIDLSDAKEDHPASNQPAGSHHWPSRKATISDEEATNQRAGAG
jgi:hypothetical protein